MEKMIKKQERNRLYRIGPREVHSVLAYAASLVLSGVPPLVCESVINELYCSVKKSLSSIIS